MSTHVRPATTHVEVDGAVPSVETLAEVATRTYGHMTVMQVRDGATRGMAMHRARLGSQHQELFGRDLDVERVQGYIAAAVREHRDGTARVVVTADDDGRDRVLVTVGPPSSPPEQPLRLVSAQFERQFPHVKHLGTFAQGVMHARAAAKGFDDTLFCDPEGNVLETTSWNVGVVSDGKVVFPEGPLLPGVTMLLLEQHLPATGVQVSHRPLALEELAEVEAVFLTNSSGVAQVASVDKVEPPMGPMLGDWLDSLYREIPADQI